MIKVDAKIYYRGACPDEGYIKKLKKMTDLQFAKVELQEIMGNWFEYETPFDSYIICPGNLGKKYERVFMSSATDNIARMIVNEWKISLKSGVHDIYCQCGDYQILTYMLPI